jgi:hypothetical protein
MDAVQYDNDKIAVLLAEKNWKLLKGKNAGRVGSTVIVRYLEHTADKLDYDSWPTLLAFLERFTSAANYEADKNAANNLVINPLVEGKAESGTFYRGPIERERGPSERVEKGHWRIIQTLFKGAADTETLHTTDDGCRYRIQRKYYVEQVAMPDVPTKSSGVETSRQFQVDPVSGLYSGYTEIKTTLYQSIASHVAAQDAFEASSIVRHLGVRTDDKDDAGNAISPAVPNPVTQLAGTLVEIDRSKNADCTQDIVVRTITAQAKTNATVSDRKEKYETTVSAEDVNQASATTPPVRVDGTIYNLETRYNKFKLYDNKLTTLTAIAVTDAVESVSHTATEKQEETLDRNGDDATLPIAQVAGVIKRTEDTTNDFGKHDVRTSTRTAVPNVTIETQDTREAYQTVGETRIKNASAALTSGAQVAGSIVTDVSQFNDFALYDTSRQTRTAVPVDNATQAKQYTAFEGRVEALNRNADAPTLTSSQTAGSIVEQQDGVNDFLKHDVKTLTRTAVAQAQAVITDVKDKFQTVLATDAVNSTSALTPPAQVDGVIVESVSRLNDFARFDTKSETRTAVAVPTTIEEVTFQAYENRSEVLDRNTVADPTLPSSQDAGVIVVKRDTVNDFGRHDIQTNTRTAVHQASAEVSDTRNAFETLAETKAENATAALTSAAQSAGTIVTDVSRLNDFARYNTSRQTRTAIESLNADTSIIHSAFETRSSDLDRNTSAPTPPSSQSAGSIVEQRDSLNDFAKHDVTTLTRTAVAQANAGALDTRTAFQTTAIVEARNAAAAVTPVDQVAGSIKTVRDTLNDFLKHDTVVETRTAVNASASNTSAVTAFTSVVTEIQHNAATLPNASANERVQGDLNDFLKYDYTKQTVTPVAADSGAYTSASNAFRTASTREYHNAASIPNAGANETVRGDINELNKFDYSKTAITPVPSNDSYVSDFGDQVKVTTERYFNADAVPDAGAVGVSVDGRLNEDGKFDYTKRTVAPVTGLIGSSHSYQLGGKIKWTDVHKRMPTSGDYPYPLFPYGPYTPIYNYTYVSEMIQHIISKLYTVRYHATEADAITAIDNGAEGSSYNKVADGLWKSETVSIVDALTGVTQEFDDPYEGWHI